MSGKGITRPARRPVGWVAPGPKPSGARGRPELEPGPGEDLCYLSGEWRLFQLVKGHRWSVDDLVAAWAGAAAGLERGARTHLDLGTGLGSVLLMIAWRMPELRSVGLEAQAERAALARRSIAWNGVEDRCRVVEGDLRDPEALEALSSGRGEAVQAEPFGFAQDRLRRGPESPERPSTSLGLTGSIETPTPFSPSGVEGRRVQEFRSVPVRSSPLGLTGSGFALLADRVSGSSFDLITGTPPYFPRGSGTESPHTGIAKSRFEHSGGVEAYLSAFARWLAPGGVAVLEANALVGPRIGPAAAAVGLSHERWIDVVPREGKPVLLRLDKFRRGPPREPARETLTVRDRSGQWTPEFSRVRAELGLPPVPPRDAAQAG